MGRKKNGTTETPKTDAAHAPSIRHRFIQKLACRIDEPALVTMAEGMAQLFEDLDAAEADRAEAMREHKATITGIKEKMKSLAKGVRSHTEMRDVECIERLTATQSIEVVRLDTGEVIEERAADAMDLQDDLFQETGEDGKTRNVRVEDAPPEPGPGDVEDPAAMLAGETQWTTGPNPKPIQPEA